MNSNRLAGLISRFTLAVLFLVSFSSARSYSFDEARADIRRGADIAKEKIKQGVQYIFSRPGVKDLAAAYCVLMGSTLTHELGHALIGRAVYGVPVKVRFGAPSWQQRKPFAEVAGVGLVGLDPLEAYSPPRYVSLPSWHPLKTVAMRMAGPIVGSLSSFYAYYLLKKNTNLPIAKLTAFGCGLSNIIGPKGLSGIRKPDANLFVVVNILRDYSALLKVSELFRHSPLRDIMVDCNRIGFGM